MRSSAMRPRAWLLATLVAALTGGCASGRAGPGPERPTPYTLPASETFSLRPRDGGAPYRILVALPLGYAREPDRRYPVVYAIDGDVGFAPFAGIIRFLAFAREMPETILVGIAYGDDLPAWRARRVADLTPVAVRSAPGSGRADRFLELIAGDLVPLIEQRYRTSPDRTLYGYSLGGLFATWVLFQHPGIFQRYVIGSPTYPFAGSVALTWPDRIGDGAAAPAGVVFTSFGTPEPANEVVAWRSFWDAVARRALPELHVLRVELDETHPAGAWICAVKGFKAVFAMSPPAVSSAER